MNNFYIQFIFASLVVLALAGLGVMVAVTAAFERIRKLEEAQAKMAEPIRSLAKDAFELQSRLFADEEERSMEAENG